jgi:hypothetical protein
MAASTRTSQWRPNSHDDDGSKPKHIVDITTTENRRRKKWIDKIGKREEGPENEENN